MGRHLRAVRAEERRCPAPVWGVFVPCVSRGEAKAVAGMIAADLGVETHVEQRQVAS